MGIFARIEKIIAIALLVIMTVVVISGALEVAWVVINDLFEPPGFFLGVEDLFDIFAEVIRNVFLTGDTANHLAAIATGGTPSDSVCLNDMHVVATLCKVQGR